MAGNSPGVMWLDPLGRTSRNPHPATHPSCPPGLPTHAHARTQISMPGMMDTVLNLGLNDACAAGLAAKSGDARFAYDAYRRFLDM